MKNNWSTCSLIISLFLMLTACKEMSEKETDKTAGINGGFEIIENNLPVNWLMYTPNTVPNSDFTITFDSTFYIEGKQSLRFDVKKCLTTGGWTSPGFSNEFSETGSFTGEGIYKLSFWVKNDGSKFLIEAGGVSAMEGDMNTLIESDEQIEEWKFLQYEINVPEDRHLRMQLNILQPGTFWIDDIQIIKI